MKDNLSGVGVLPFGLAVQRSNESTLRIFNFKSTEIRISDRNGNFWFVLADVCDALGIGNPSDVARRLDEDEKNTLDLIEGKGNPQKTIVNESGLYNVILRSDKPEAKAFKRWITHDVLPSIRKTGGYQAPAASIRASVDSARLDRLEGLVEQLVGALVKNISPVAEEPLKSEFDTPVSRDRAHLTGYEAGELLGVSRQLLFTWRKSGKLRPVFKTGPIIYVAKDVFAILDAQEKRL